jgi:prepilin-type N-terminal cleavage/methylation domain-containing protein
MRERTGQLPSSGASGFSMIELLVVIGLIVVMSAVAVPNIIGYLRNARVRGAMTQVAGEIQTARNKAIVKNTNLGVAFAVIDSDTYRFFVEDDPPGASGLGPLRNLPDGVFFVPAALPGFAFDRLGRACQYGGAGCPVAGPPAMATLCPTPGELSRCTNATPGSYVQLAANGSLVVTMRDNVTQLTRTVQVAPGGRVLSQR